MNKILQEDIWLFNPEPTIRKAIGKKLHPGIVISHNIFNRSLSGLVIIIPLFFI